MYTLLVAFFNPITKCSPLANRKQESFKRFKINTQMMGETEVRHYLRHCMHSSKVHSPYSAVRRRDRRSWILTRRPFLSALSIRFHFNSHSNTNLISGTVEPYLRALQFSRQHLPDPTHHPPFVQSSWILREGYRFLCEIAHEFLTHGYTGSSSLGQSSMKSNLASILFTHQQMHFLLNLEKFKFTWKYT